MKWTPKKKKKNRRKKTYRRFFEEFCKEKKTAEKWSGSFRGKWEKEGFCLRMGDGIEYLYINQNNPAKRRKSMIWEKRGYIHRSNILREVREVALS